MGKENLPISMGIFMRGIGKMIKQRAMAHIIIIMEHSMKDTGRTIANMALGHKYGSMEANMKAITSMEKRMEKENTCGKTEATIMEAGEIIK